MLAIGPHVSTDLIVPVQFRTAQLPVRHSAFVRHACVRKPPPPVQSRWHEEPVIWFPARS